jgi:hypothetical protein
MVTLPITLKGSQFAVSSISAPAGLSIAGLSDGDIVISWQDGSNAAVQLFNGSGAAVSSEVVAAISGGASETLTQEIVVGLADGNFVVTWNDTVASGGNTYVDRRRADV